MEEYIENENVVAIRLAENTEFELPITIVDTEDMVTISVSLDSHLYKASADNEFPAFQKLRDMLLDKGIGLKCCGAMINAHQSGMMANSDKVYLLTLGKPALLKDTAIIYDYADIKEFPNTLEQERFVEEWFNSLEKCKRMENYKKQIQSIRMALEELDNASEYNEGKYLTLQESLISIVQQALTNSTLSQTDKENVYSEASSLLGSYIRCVEDVERYFPQIEALYSKGLITAEQLDFFDSNMNGRWR